MTVQMKNKVKETLAKELKKRIDDTVEEFMNEYCDGGDPSRAQINEFYYNLDVLVMSALMLMESREVEDDE